MSPIEKIKKIIRGRPCFVVAKGASLNILERKIEEYRDLDVCWITLNDFHYIENTILCKINKKFDLVSDCATVSRPEHYEPNVRIPRFKEYLERSDDNLLMLSALVIQYCFLNTGNNEMLNNHIDKVVVLDDLFSSPGVPNEVWEKPPNSITLLYAFLIAGGAKTIINFGLDGHQRNVDTTSVSEEFIRSTGTPILSYYMPEIVKQERMDGFGDYRDGSLHSDGADFNIRWGGIQKVYEEGFNNPDVKFYNCSPISTITAFPRISYDQVKGLV